MANFRPCRLEVIVLLSFAKYANERPWAEAELIEKLKISKSIMGVYLWRWEHQDRIIRREVLPNGVSLYHVTDMGEEYLARVKKIPIRNLRKVAVPTR